MMNDDRSPIGELLDSVKSLFDFESGPPFSDAHVQLALTVMLVDLALVDNEFDDDEYRAIYHVLREKLAVESPQAHELIAEARSLVRKSTEKVESFSVFLAKRLSKTEREKLMIDFVELMGADGIIHPFEVDLKARYEELLGLKK